MSKFSDVVTSFIKDKSRAFAAPFASRGKVPNPIKSSWVAKRFNAEKLDWFHVIKVYPE